MAKATKTENNETPAQPIVASNTPMTMMPGCTVAIYGFIPIPKDDLRRQIEISQTLLDFQEGKKTVADLAAFMKQVEVKTTHVSRRVTAAEARDWSAQKTLALQPSGNDEGNGQPPKGTTGAE